MANAVILGDATWRLQDQAATKPSDPVAPPGPGTEYEILGVLHHIRIIDIAVAVTWTVQPTPLEAHLDLDGIRWTFTVTNPVSDTWYHAVFSGTSAVTGQPLSSVDVQMYRSHLIDGEHVTDLTAETTGGTVSALYGRCIYALKM